MREPKSELSGSVNLTVTFSVHVMRARQESRVHLSTYTAEKPPVLHIQSCLALAIARHRTFGS